MERRLLLVDLRDARERSNVKACPTCGARPSEANVTATGPHELLTRVFAVRENLGRDGWMLDLSHPDTYRFNEVFTSDEPPVDLVFVIALTR